MCRVITTEEGEVEKIDAPSSECRKMIISMEEDRLNGKSAPGVETFAKHSG